MFTKILLEALGYVYHYRIRLAKALVFPFIVLWALTLFTVTQPSPGASFVIQVLYLFFQMSIIVSTHRIILLGEDSVPVFGAMVWSRDVLRAVRYPIYFGLLSIPVFFFVGIIVALVAPPNAPVGSGAPPQILSVLLIVLTIALVITLMRFSLVFPASAVNDEHGLALSWKQTRHNKKLMFNAVILVPFVCGLPFILLNFIDGAIWLTTPFSLIVSIVGVASLSVAYSTITNRQMGMVKPIEQ